MAQHVEPENLKGSGTPGHEKTDADVKSILTFLISLAVLLLIIMGLMSWLFNIFESYRESQGYRVTTTVDPAMVPPQPRLQADPEIDMRALWEREDKLLNSYGWVDQNAGVFHIPIDRAMDLIAESGLPYRQNESTESGGGK